MKLHPTWRTFVATMFLGVLFALGCSSNSGGTNDPGQIPDPGPADVAQTDTMGDPGPASDPGQGLEVALGEVSGGLSAKSSAAQGDPCDPTTVTSAIVITEFMANPDLGQPALGEYIELHNPGASPLDINNWYLSDNAAVYQVQPIPPATDVIVPAGGFVLVCASAAYSAANGGLNCSAEWVGTAGFGLDDDGDEIVLIEGVDVIDEILYTNTVPQGYAISLRHPFLNNQTLAIPPANPEDPASWNGLDFGITDSSAPTPPDYQYTTGNWGTPGTKNEDVWEIVEFDGCKEAPVDNICTWNTCEAGACKTTTKTSCCTADDDCSDQTCKTKQCILTPGDPLINTCQYDPIPECCTNDDISNCDDGNPCNNDWCYNGTCAYPLADAVPGCCWAHETLAPNGNPWPNPEARQAYANSKCTDKPACVTDATCWLDPSVGIHVQYQCEYGAPDPDCCNWGTDCIPPEGQDPCKLYSCENHVCVIEDKAAVSGYECCIPTDHPYYDPTNPDHDINVQCDDGDPCTKEQCLGGLCKPQFDPALCCPDNAFCVDYDNDNNPCTDEVCLLNPQTGIKQCEHVYVPLCHVEIPYIEDFDDAMGFSSVGWQAGTELTDFASGSAGNWIMGTTGELGPDQHVQFRWNPTIDVKSVAVTPVIDASSAGTSFYNPENKTTLQWRMSYTHSQPGEPVYVRVVASTDGDYENGVVLWQYDPDHDGGEDPLLYDLPYDLYSVELPAGYEISETLQIGFMIEAVSTFNMDNLQFDNIVLAEGVTNRLKKAFIYRCEDSGSCSFQNPDDVVLEQESGNPCVSAAECATGTECINSVCSGIPDLVMFPDHRYQYVLCYSDPDTFPTQYIAWGRPHAYLDGPPLQQASFVTPWDFTSIGDACSVNPGAVNYWCGVGVADYICVLDVDPEGSDAHVGRYTLGILGLDEWKPTGTEDAHSPFESLNKAVIHVLLDSGYLIWSPLGLTDPSANAMLDSLLDPTDPLYERQAQIITSLDIIDDLNRYDGILGALGAYGRYHPMAQLNANRIKDFLDAGIREEVDEDTGALHFVGGRVYVEGGEFWNTASTVQDETVLHNCDEALCEDYFKIEGISDGASKLDGPLEGQHVWYGMDFDYSQGPLFNSWLDRIRVSPDGDGREVMQNGGTASFATAVNYEHCGPSSTCWDKDDDRDCDDTDIPPGFDPTNEDVNDDDSCDYKDCLLTAGNPCFDEILHRTIGSSTLYGGLINCWDINKNGACDVPEEDIDGNGDCNRSDCSTVGATNCQDWVNALSDGEFPPPECVVQDDAMAEMVYFLEQGYRPCDYTAGAQAQKIRCSDDKVCTTDSCQQVPNQTYGICKNVPIQNCWPCDNDQQPYKVTGDPGCADGPCPACNADQACWVAEGYCVDILCDDDDDPQTPRVECGVKALEPEADQQNLLFGGENPPFSAKIVNSTILVLQPGWIRDLQVKAKIFHAYRGDVQLSLQGPDGTTLQLKQANLADADQGIYATYDIGEVISCDNPPCDQIDSFDGKGLQGPWKLIAEDISPLIFNGMLESWKLYAAFTPTDCTTPDPTPTVPPCSDDSDCNAGEACDGGLCWEEDPQCADGNGCTFDRCVGYNPGFESGTCDSIVNDCDDGNHCTLDACNSINGSWWDSSCDHTPQPGSGCGCLTHADCPIDEACLDDVTGLLCSGGGCHCNLICDTGLYGDDCGTYHDTFNPISIPDPGNISEILTISGVSGVVRQLWVRVFTDHMNIGDLSIELCKDGTCVNLHFLSGFGAGNLWVFDYDPPPPGQDMEDFKTLPVDGDWELKVSDNIETIAPDGTLLAYSVFALRTACYEDTDCTDYLPGGDPNLCTQDECVPVTCGGICIGDADCPSGTRCVANACECRGGSCVAGECDDINACEHIWKECEPTNNDCTVSQCNPDNAGACEEENLADGLACDDLLYCTTGDECVTGVCTGSTDRDCSAMDGTCLKGWCDENIDSCVQFPLKDGVDPGIGDDFACNTPICYAEGTCDPACGAGDVCVNGQCETEGDCSASPCEVDEVCAMIQCTCDAGEICLAGDYCDAGGNCIQGATPVCVCTEDEDCTDDGDLCNGILDTCENLFCVLGTPEVDCDATNPPLPACEVYQCKPIDGQCFVKNALNFTPCEDDLFCTVSDYCKGGQCLSEGEIYATQGCAADDDCHKTCSDPADCASNNCVGGLCLGGFPEDQLGLCNVAEGLCYTHDRDCSAALDGLSDADKLCNEGLCNDTTDSCFAQVVPDDTECEFDGLGCTKDWCQTGVCGFNENVDCYAEVGDLCNNGVCHNLGWGGYQCLQVPKPDGHECDSDNDPCTDDFCYDAECAHFQLRHCTKVLQTDVGADCGYVNPGDPGGHMYNSNDGMCGWADSCVDGIYGYPNGTCTPTCGGNSCVSSTDCAVDEQCIDGQCSGTFGVDCIRVSSTVNEILVITGDVPGDPLVPGDGEEYTNPDAAYINLPLAHSVGSNGCQLHKLTVNSPWTYVKEVQIKADVVHSYLADLTVEVIDPQGYNHFMWNHIGANNQDFHNTFDLSLPVPYQHPPGTPLLPESGLPMCSLKGEQASGDWFLRICDKNGPSGGGFLHEWKIFVFGHNHEDGPCDTGADNVNQAAADAFCQGQYGLTARCDPSTQRCLMNAGHRWQSAIDLGNLDIVPLTEFSGTTECSVNSASSSCGGAHGADRIYKFDLSVSKRVTVELMQEAGEDLIVFIKSDACMNGTGPCESGSEWCEHLKKGPDPELLDIQLLLPEPILEPAVFYLGVDTVDDNIYTYGDYTFHLRLRELLDDGQDCDPSNNPGHPEFLPINQVHPFDLDCFSGHCKNGYCCRNRCIVDPSTPYPDCLNDPVYDPKCVVQDPAYPACNPSDCCPGGIWSAPIDGNDPDQIWKADTSEYVIKTAQPDWVSAQAVCPSNYVVPEVCGPDTPTGNTFPPPPSDQFLNDCQGERHDSNCEYNTCISTRVDDDSACLEESDVNYKTEARECGWYKSEWCGTRDAIPHSPPDDPPDGVPGSAPNAQLAPDCPTTCLEAASEDDTKCDDAVSIYPDDLPGYPDSYTGSLPYPGAHCDPDPAAPANSICQADLVDGSACNENSDCQSSYCLNGFCCKEGDCCPTNDPDGAMNCILGPDVEDEWWNPPTCTNAATCEGGRQDPICVNYMCGKQPVLDDCACADEFSQNCGMFISVFCPYPLIDPGNTCTSDAECNALPNGECRHDNNPNTLTKYCWYPDADAPAGSCAQENFPVDLINDPHPPYDMWDAIAPTCLESCLNLESCTLDTQCPYGECADTGFCEDDRLCIDIAHCDKCTEVNSGCDAANVAAGDYMCQADLPYGYPCSEDTDCKNYASNDECVVNIDPTCDPGCGAGEVCLNGECETEGAGCGGTCAGNEECVILWTDAGHCQNGYCCLADDCCRIDLAEIACNVCESEGACNPACGAGEVCVKSQLGDYCTEGGDPATDCEPDCDAGEVCAVYTNPEGHGCPDPNVCHSGTYSAPPACDDITTCQGHRVDARCNATFTCGSADMEDDRGCTPTDEVGNPWISDQCKYFESVFCVGDINDAATKFQYDPPCPQYCLAEDSVYDGNVLADPVCDLTNGCIGGCDLNAHCDPPPPDPCDVMGCAPNDGLSCTGNGQCASNNCDGGFCADATEAQCVYPFGEWLCKYDADTHPPEADGPTPPMTCQPDLLNDWRCDEVNDCTGASSTCQLSFCCNVGLCCMGCKPAGWIPTVAGGGTAPSNECVVDTDCNPDGTVACNQGICSAGSGPMHVHSAWGQLSPTGQDPGEPCTVNGDCLGAGVPGAGVCGPDKLCHCTVWNDCHSGICDKTRGICITGIGDLGLLPTSTDPYFGPNCSPLNGDCL